MLRPLFLVAAVGTSFGFLRAETPLTALTGTYRCTGNAENFSVDSVKIASSGRILVNTTVWSVGPDDAVGRRYTLVGTVGRTRVVKRGGRKVLITRLEAANPSRSPAFTALARVEERIVRGKVRKFSGKVTHGSQLIAKFSARRIAGK